MNKELWDTILPRKRYLTVRDVAMAYSVHERTVRRWAEQGTIAGAVKSGSKLWRFVRSILLENPPQSVLT